ncbi:hypothetical protein [Kytococcus sedentarius]|uniref:hypothetical protein n=1 Tax=Kytococcus sedentarius TaxID=1276 RepID=UPI0035BBD16C
MRRSLTITALLGLSAVLTACGDDEGDGGTSSEATDSPTSSVTESSEPGDETSSESGEPSESSDAPSPSGEPSESGETSSDAPSPSGDGDGAHAPFDGSLLADGEEASETLKGTVQGAPSWMTFTDEGVNSAALAARCDGQGQLKLQPLATDLDSSRPGEPQTLPCDGERHDITLQGEKPFTSVLIIATSQPATFEVAALEVVPAGGEDVPDSIEGPQALGPGEHEILQGASHGPVEIHLTCEGDEAVQVDLGDEVLECRQQDDEGFILVTDDDDSPITLLVPEGAKAGYVVVPDEDATSA